MSEELKRINAELLTSIKAILELEGESVDENRYGTGDTERAVFNQARETVARAEKLQSL
jgi:hypothetical protein